ncbi:F-box/WD repeat-containing protein 8-like isoform X1 [Pomacea canaliculata]|uniref:F-box/WD repeat-containing protein 8-like isoform X1 n=1 Tax=Pomacea canaliculata TaxID=400727 RepID=UPI000D72F0B0|nr:F-box/WD repeat-containing protein 8-like isoform X1 [Pomacea canaliculata]
MNSQKDLDDFRNRWLEELKHQIPVGEQHSASGELKDCANDELESVDSCKEDVISKPHENCQITDNPRIPPLHGNYCETGSTVPDATPQYFPFRVLSKVSNPESWEEVQRARKRFASDKCSAVTSVKKGNYFAESSHTPAQQRNSVSNQYVASINQKKETISLLVHKERYLDLFIADLNEINEIPFFDISIPRELAIKIFWHLDATDLCHCAQVSKSWRSLAEDELLWCRLCHQLGFEQEKVTVECADWKRRVQHYTILNRTLDHNWKNRTGKLHSLQHVKGGVLCAASSFKSFLVAGYSNCQTKLWDVYSGETCIFQPSSTALILDENTEEGTITNEVQHVAACSKVTAASYSHNFVDVWSNEEGTSPIYTVSQFGTGLVSALKLWENNCSVFTAVACGSTLQVHVVEHSYGHLKEHMDFELNVKDLVWLQSHSASPSLTPIIAVATVNTVSIGKFSTDTEHLADWFEIHNIVDAPITCLDARLDPSHVAVGFSFYSFPSELIKVNVYDLTTQQLVTTLSGHTSVLSCINVVDSPPFQLVSGSRDRKVRVYDTRIDQSAMMTLIGHSSTVTCVQMDNVKVVSGDEGGFVCVWDQRMASKLWEMHDRHPVSYCHFDERLLVVAHEPVVKQQQSKYDYDTGLHQRHRGSFHVYDFLTDQTTKGVPDICLSTYDEPQGYNYNICLTVPYDQV